MSRSMPAPTWSASCSFRRRRGIWRFDAARALGKRVRGRAQKVALTVDADDALLDAIVESLQPDMLQLHGKELPARVAALKQRFGLPVMKAIAVAAKADLAAIDSLCRRRRSAVVRRAARRARRRGRAASASRSTGICWKISIPACRSCSRAASMPAMSARRCASRARPASMSPRASSARRARRTSTRSAPSCARRARRRRSIAAQPVASHA